MLTEIDPNLLKTILATHLPMYRTKVPHYQAKMLTSLRQLWLGKPRSLLDVGGGTGVIAEAISELFPVGEVHAIDVVNRFCPTLTVATQQYDGTKLPFEDDRFDAATLNNVMHHVPVDARANLLREIRRVVSGPLYIKDHETSGITDNLRLVVLDAIGNIPFGGMLSAHYLSAMDWEQLAANSGYRISARAAPAQYRAGAFERLFPNRLEVVMRFERN